ncbi:MAG: glycosyltransferase [Faecousia sp.]
MRVLYLINYAGKAGMEKYVENLARLLTPEGAQCHFAYGIPGELSEKMERAGIPSLRLSLEWKDALSAARTLANYCRDKGIGVIHAQCARENVIALLAKRRLPTLRVVYTLHFTTPAGKLWRLLNRVFTPKDDCVIAVCREAAEVFAQNGGCTKRLRVIYNGIEPAKKRRCSDGLRRELGLEENVFLMATLARLAPEKGLDFLLDSLAALKTKTERPFCCAIAGDGELAVWLRQRAGELGLEDQVRLLGYRTDAPEILASSALYLCSSRCNEALSFGILEAMNTGLPCVVTDVGGNRDLVETGGVCGRVVPFGDTAAFAGAIRELMETESLERELSDAALKKVEEKFNLNRLALDVYKTYFD